VGGDAAAQALRMRWLSRACWLALMLTVVSLVSWMSSAATGPAQF